MFYKKFITHTVYMYLHSKYISAISEVMIAVKTRSLYMFTHMTILNTGQLNSNKICRNKLVNNLLLFTCTTLKD